MEFRISYGGNEVKGKRKIQRPFTSADSLALVFTARHSSGKLSLLHRINRARVESRIYTLARRYHIKIHRLVNRGSFLVIFIRPNNRYQLTCFLRTSAGQMAQLITGARKGLKTGKYWGNLCWSTVLRSPEKFKNILYALSKLTNPLSVPRLLYSLEKGRLWKNGFG